MIKLKKALLVLGAIMLLVACEAKPKDTSENEKNTPEVLSVEDSDAFGVSSGDEKTDLLEPLPDNVKVAPYPTSLPEGGDVQNSKDNEMENKEVLKQDQTVSDPRESVPDNAKVIPSPNETGNYLGLPENTPNLEDGLGFPN